MPFPFEELDDREFDDATPGGIDYASIALQGGSDDEDQQCCPRHGLLIDLGDETLPRQLGCDMCLREFVGGVVA